MPSDPRAPAWRELFQAFGRIGVMSFGGPAAQISVMHGELVDRRRWLSEDSFLGLTKTVSFTISDTLRPED